MFSNVKEFLIPWRGCAIIAMMTALSGAAQISFAQEIDISQLPRPSSLGPGWVIIDGDIAVREETLLGGPDSFKPGSAWPDGLVPFEFAPSVSASNRSKMILAMNELSSRFIGDVNIKFVQRIAEPDYLYILNDKNTYSSGVGLEGGVQYLGVSVSDWDVHYALCHELMHVIGFYHEQSRPDRDSHVKIIWENVSPSQILQFELAVGSTTNNTPYDYTSIMHYSQCAYSICSKCSEKPEECRTIETLDPAFQNVIGNKSKLGDWDGVEMQLVYGPSAVWYCDAGYGNVGSGTIADPYKHSPSAYSSIPAGHTLILHGGHNYIFNGNVLDRPMVIRTQKYSSMLVKQ